MFRNTSEGPGGPQRASTTTTPEQRLASLEKLAACPDLTKPTLPSSTIQTAMQIAMRGKLDVVLDDTCRPFTQEERDAIWDCRSTAHIRRSMQWQAIKERTWLIGMHVKKLFEGLGRLIVLQFRVWRGE